MIGYDYEAYDEKLKSEFTVMVTTPDPKDGHTHIVYVDSNGNGISDFYPKEDPDAWFKHQHFVVDNKLIPHTDGYSISFHAGLTGMAEAKNQDESVNPLSEVFDSTLSGKVGNGIPTTNEADVVEEISKTRKAKDAELQSKIKQVGG